MSHQHFLKRLSIGQLVVNVKLIRCPFPSPRDSVKAIRRRIVGNKSFREVMLALTVSTVYWVPRSYSLFQYLSCCRGNIPLCSYSKDRITFVFTLCISSPFLRFWKPVWRTVVIAFTSWWHLRSSLKEFWCRQFCPKTTPPLPSTRGCSASSRYGKMREFWVESNDLWAYIDLEYIPVSVFSS